MFLSVCLYTVYDLRVTSCPTSRVADVTTVEGYLSNTLGPLHESCGWRTCPWVIRGVPGQRIELSLIVLGHLRHPGHCPSIVLAEPRADDDVIDDVINRRRAFDVCSTVTRQRRLYTTSGHVLVAYTSINRTGQGQGGRGQGQDLGQDYDVVAGRRFLLMYKSLYTTLCPIKSGPLDYRE